VGNLITIDDHNWMQHAAPPSGQGMGLIPRNFNKCPVGYLMYAKPFDLPLMSDQEIEEAIVAQERDQSSLQHIRDKGDNGKQIVSYDQNGQGYCWAYSTVSALTLARAAAGLPYVRLSAHKVGCFVKGYRDQGGWNAQSVAHVAEHGVPSEALWPAKSMSRSNDTPEMRANAALHKAIEWMDMAEGGEILKRQQATALCQNIPYAADRNWWGHSTCDCRLIAWGPNGSRMKTRTWNSWTNSWSDAGMGDIEGSRVPVNGGIAIRVTSPSVV
jgi:hypothetical protein